ncbi:MAG: sigma-70 family RNA polymerase sigma factor [Clostridia bacterium]|nr:sigma-70 family RNA polymerase sigma factor [Clostridia bacterium]
MTAAKARLSLLKKAQGGDRSAEEAFLTENLGLVRAVVARFSGRDSEELFQIGCMGLLKAMRRFDFNYDVAFSTYAVPLILGEIRQFLRRDGTLHVSRSVKEDALRIRRAEATLEQELSRAPTVSELSAATGIPAEAVVTALASTAVCSIHELGEAATDPDFTEALDLKRAIGMLSLRERQVVGLRMFRDCTQTETAAVLGISQTQVSRIERGAIKQLQKNLIGEEP